MDKNYNKTVEENCIKPETGENFCQPENNQTEYYSQNDEASDGIEEVFKEDRLNVFQNTISKDLLLEMTNQFGIIETSPEMKLQRLYQVLTLMNNISKKLLDYEWKFDGTLLAQAYFEYLTDSVTDIRQSLKMLNKERKAVYSYLVQRIKFNSFILSNRDMLDHFYKFYQICLKETVKYIPSIPEINRKDVYCFAEPVERSSEKISEYLLKLAEVLCPTATQDKLKGRRLAILNTRLKRIVKVLDSLKEFNWLEDLPAVQTATLNFFLAKLISKEEKKQVNKLISKRIKFCIYMSENREIINQFYIFYQQHLYNIEKYLAAHPILSEENESAEESLETHNPDM